MIKLCRFDISLELFWKKNIDYWCLYELVDDDCLITFKFFSYTFNDIKTDF